MSWKNRLAQTFVRFLSARDFQEVASSAAARIVDRMEREEKLAFFRCFVEEHLGTLLAGLERAALMNALLPTLAQEFLLADLDILGAFSPAGDPWAEGDEQA